MLQNAAIDVAIGLILMYLMLSLLCTTVNEYIATKLSLRANSLSSALEELLDNGTLRTAFYDHGLIVGTKRTVATGTQSIANAVTDVATAATQSIKRLMGPAPVALALQPPVAPAQPPAAPAQPALDATKDHPSYLSGNTVALALIGSLTPGTPIPGMADIRAAVQTLPDSKIRDVLFSCLTEAQNDFGALQKSIATWFDDAMDRLSGAYKRQIQWISMLVGLAVAIAFNADSFHVATTLWKDPDRRAAAVQMAESVAKQSIAATGQQTPATGQQSPANGQQTLASGQPITDAQLKEQVEKTESSLRSLPIGWSCPANPQAAASTTTPKPDMTWEDSAKQYWECAHKQKISVLQFLGWLLTAAALSLGAPFWFDLLNQFINLRGAGTKPQRADAGS